MIKFLLISLIMTFSTQLLANSDLPPGPSSIIQKEIAVEKINSKEGHSFQIKWAVNNEADTYKVIIIRKDKHFRKVYHVATNQLTYTFVPNTPYAWKVVARKKSKDITKFSSFYDFSITNQDWEKEDSTETKINDVAWEKETYQPNSNLPRGPGAKIPGEFRFNEIRTLYPVQLKWEPVAEANLYEIEIIRLSSKRRMFYYSSTNNFHVELFPNVEYHWRVLAYKGKEKLTNYSYPFYLKVIFDSDGSPVTDITSSDNKLSLDELDKKEKEYFNNLKYNEEIRDKELNFQKTNTKNIKQAKKIESALKNTNQANYSLLQQQITDLKLQIDNQKKQHQSEIDRLKEKLSESGQKTYELNHWNKSWARAGVGLRFTRYDQDINSNTNAAVETNRLYHATNGDTSFNLSGGHYFKPNIGVEGQLVYSSGSFLEVTDKVLVDYSWIEFHLEGIYILGDEGYKTKKDHWFLRGGLLYQTLSLLATFPAPSTVYEVVDNNNYFLSAGGGYSKMLSQNFKASAYGSLLFQILGSSSKYSYNSEFGYGLNSHARLEYLLSESIQVGLDWQLQFIEISYNLTNGTQQADGSQNLIQNKFGLYLNYIF